MSCVEMVVERTVPGRRVIEMRRPVARKAIDPDAALVARLRRADPAAPEALVDAYGSRAYRLAVRITGNVADAEEVVQDALWTVVRKIESFRGESAFGSWLYRIVANGAYQKVRGRRRHPEISLDDVLPGFHDDGSHAAPADDWSRTVDDPSRQSDVRGALSAALDALSAGDRTAVLLHDVEGFSIAEVAATVGLTAANTKSRVHRARLFLRQRLAVSLGAA
jgi:RNA polymerase sigma-70 factor, ECF subfamily